MKKPANKRNAREEFRKEYDLSKLRGARGEDFERYRKGRNLVLLSPDVAEFFPDEKSGNTALRSLIPPVKHSSRRSH
jgi:hypothetical protein